MLTRKCRTCGSRAGSSALWKALEQSGGLRRGYRRAKDKPSQAELRASFAKQLENGGPVTREEAAAWLRITVRQLSRYVKDEQLHKLPEYGRKAMFDSRVACRLRPKRKEG